MRRHVEHRHLWMSLVSALVLIAVGILHAANDAEYVSCTIPDTVITDEVFDAQIVMRNTGTEPWAMDQVAVTLVSQSPPFNMTWGTYFIILGQGITVAPGDTFAFASPLKAPSEPGTHEFVWQCQNWLGAMDTTTPFFGEMVAGESIVVTQRQETPPSPPVHRDSLLDTSDFVYEGSFGLPDLPGQENLYTESGMALRTVAGGQKRLLLNTGTYEFSLYEISIPALVKIDNGDHSGVNTATLEREWGDISIGTVGGEEISSNAGFWFDDSTGLLYWCHYNGYFTGAADDWPVLTATRLNDDGTTSQVHSWYLPASLQRFKGHWGGITRLSQRFADEHTGGRDLALGYGGYYSICNTASRGPALAALARPDSTQDQLDVVEMLTYPDPIAAPRDGNYIPQVGFWNDYPASPWEGSWTYNDYCRAGVFIDLPDKQGYLVFAQQVIGRIGYDYGGYNTDGHTQNSWYFYDIDTLGAAARGDKAPESILPSSYAVVGYPLDGGLVPGACFDPEARMLYVYVQWSIDGQRPVVHAYSIREGQSGVRRLRDVRRVSPSASTAIYDIRGRRVESLAGRTTASSLVPGVYLRTAAGDGRVRKHTTVLTTGPRQ